MKKKVISVIATCCLLAVSVASSARAQTPFTRLRVRIPFDFSVRGRILPAGEYEINRVGETPEVLLLSGVTNRDHAVFNTESVVASKIPNRGKIVFHRYGDSYFLSEVFVGGEQTGRELPESHQERALEREMAAGNNKKNQPETVALATY